MKKLSFIIISLSLAAVAGAQKVDRSIKPKPGPAPEFKLGKSETFTTANGMKVFVVENHKLPVIACNIEFDIKPELEGDMAGYSDMLSDLLLSGTKNRSKDKLNEEIDRLGAQFNASGNSLSASGLKKYTEKMLDLMSDIAMNSDIKQEELDKTREKMLSGMEAEKNDPDAMVRHVSAAVNFGSNHPYGEVATEESIKKITLARCTNYYHTYFRPNVVYMAIVGDITAAEVKPLIEKYFGNWERKDVPVTNYTIPALGENKLTKVAFAPRVAAVQSVVSVTYPVDLKPGSPDLIKAKVANTVLGGGSQGRLFLDLREKHAWTYGAYSSLKEDELGGSFSATVKCRNVVSDSSVEALLSEMKTMQTDRVSDSALQNSISYLSGNFSIALEDPARIAQLAIRTERYHLPKDYYQNYLKNLSAVTADDIMEVSKKYIRPDHANIVVAGSKDEVAGKLARFSADGKIDYYDYSGKPMVVTENKPLPPGMTADDVYKKYISAMGGEAAYNSIKDIKIVSTSEEQGMPLTITEVKKSPNLWKQVVEVAMNGQKMVAQKQVYNGTKGFQEQMGQKADMSQDDVDDILADADITGDLHPEKYGIKRSLKSMDNIDGHDVYVVESVNAKGKKTMEYYDAGSSLLVRRVITVAGPKETMTQISDYKNYKEVPGGNGYKIPYDVSESQQGHVLKAQVQTVEVNKGIADTEFN